jgi:hypothetical protein
MLSVEISRQFRYNNAIGTVFLPNAQLLKTILFTL